MVMVSGRRVVSRALAGTAAVILMLLAPDLYGYLPQAVRRHRLGWVLGGLAVSYGVGRLWVGRRSATRAAGDPLRRLLDRLDVLAGFAIRGGLSVVVVVTCLCLLATWVPHYLLWPWYRDTDTFATMAQSWDAGILPYRDIRAYNFPGAIYLCWVLGKVAGFGRTWAFYAVDSAVVAFLGMVLAAWSRRCLGRVLPGVSAYLVFLTSYLSRDYFTVAQRDWHASLCVVLGLLALQAWPGRSSRLVSALLAAAALAIRPHVVVFLPALAAAVAEGVATEPPGIGLPGPHPPSGRLRALAEWLLAFGSFTVIAFAPLLIAGIADDLMRGLTIATAGGPYGRATRASIAQVFADELRDPATWIVVVLLGITVVGSWGASRRRAATWSVALTAALLYRLFHPVQHDYLAYPVVLVSSIASALPIAWLLDRPRVAPFLQVTMTLLLMDELSPGPPRYCNSSASLEALSCLVRGETIPASSPPGSRAWFDLRRGRWYPWEDYRRVLIHLRETTRPSTLVANVLKEPPFPAINGPTARLSPFRAESGICWMLLVDLDLDAEFAAALEQATDAVVVWSPAEHELPSQLRLPGLTATIRKHYRLEARFGRIEVWRRATSPSTTAVSARPLRMSARPRLFSLRRFRVGSWLTLGIGAGGLGRSSG
jgi:hypothetical protein